MSKPPPSRDGELRAYLEILAAGREPGQFFDVRCATSAGGMRQHFIPAEHLERAVTLIISSAWRTDVYVGVALRDGRDHGGKSAIAGSRLLYIECDHPDSHARLQDLACAPSIMVASGSPGHLHAYWSLHELATAAQVESANRRLAAALSGDPASVDIARVLRPPASMNHKHQPPLPVRLLALDRDARYALSELTDGLPADPQPARVAAGRGAPRRRTARGAVDRALLAIPAAEYVRVLTGREPSRAGKVLCPFHEDTNPSLQIYPDGSFYCYGRACRKGGTIFDFAAALWGLATKEEDFLELRERLATQFALTPTSPGRP
ncbi:MAG TPA: DNA-primase RepB domain-containing protein [Solirubrobacteraceae bacterium]|nr:DNA-primase RepB domain-containing protein [Solirubrobacteraceae bacterium]